MRNEIIITNQDISEASLPLKQAVPKYPSIECKDVSKEGCKYVIETKGGFVPNFVEGKILEKQSQKDCKKVMETKGGFVPKFVEETILEKQIKMVPEIKGEDVLNLSRKHCMTGHDKEINIEEEPEESSSENLDEIM